jgi:hypothetical protein
MGFVAQENYQQTSWEIDLTQLPGFEQKPDDYTYQGINGKSYRVIRDPQGKIGFYIGTAQEEPPPEVVKNKITNVVKRKYPGMMAIGAYTKDRVKENLPKLFALCNAIPEKIFIAAAGNFEDDLRGFTKPDNLLTVAQWDGDRKRPGDSVFGADIYVDNYALENGWGSSFSTPVISAVASVLADEGLPAPQIKEKILSYCNKEKVDGDEVNLFDPTKAEFK